MARRRPVSKSGHRLQFPFFTCCHLVMLLQYRKLFPRFFAVKLRGISSSSECQYIHETCLYICSICLSYFPVACGVLLDHLSTLFMRCLYTFSSSYLLSSCLRVLLDHRLTLSSDAYTPVPTAYLTFQLLAGPSRPPTDAAPAGGEPPLI